MTTPGSTDGIWVWVPIIRNPDVSAELADIKQQLGAIMAAVRVEQSDLDALDAALDAATQSLADKIAALNLPAADLTALQEDLTTLQSLGAPAPVEEPPVA